MIAHRVEAAASNSTRNVKHFSERRRRPLCLRYRARTCETADDLGRRENEGHVRPDGPERRFIRNNNIFVTTIDAPQKGYDDGWKRRAAERHARLGLLEELTAAAITRLLVESRLARIAFSSWMRSPFLSTRS